MAQFIQKEKSHYDKQAARRAKSRSLEKSSNLITEKLSDLESRYTRASFFQWKKWVSDLEELSKGRLLDFGSGQGHLTFLLKQLYPKAEVHGIDISTEAIEFAKRYGKGPIYQVMDAHDLQAFERETFDLVSDFESFSSLDLKKAFAEILRVLKPGGLFLMVETFGHNPLLNWKRKLNVLRGTRTSWAEKHILTETTLQWIQGQFDEVEVKYFGLSTLGLGLLGIRSSKFLAQLENVDEKLFEKIPALRKYAFKVVLRARKRRTIH